MEILSAVFDFYLAIPWWVGLIALLVELAIRDIFFNTYHTIPSNFLLVGHIRYMLESIGPELRQYIVANNRKVLPLGALFPEGVSQDFAQNFVAGPQSPL